MHPRSPGRSATLLFCLAALAVGSSIGSPPSGPTGPGIPRETSATRLLQRTPPLFVENRGQVKSPAPFIVTGKDKTLSFGPRGIAVSLSARLASAGIPDRTVSTDTPPRLPARHTIRVEFVGGREVQPAGLEQQVTRMSWFRGRPDQWITDVPTYGGVRYREVWPGIDAVYRGETGRVKGEYVVAPGADPGKVCLRYRGATSLRIDSDGGLRIETPAGELTDPVPVAYQEVDGVRRTVGCAYDLRGEVCGFRLEEYDRALPLIIDPVTVIYCGFIGGSGGENAFDYLTSGMIAVDDAGSAYVVGATTSVSGFPVTPGSFGPNPSGDYDAFVAKVSADGSSLLYCGFLGGTGRDSARAVTVDGLGRAYVVGLTLSDAQSLPVRVGPSLTPGPGTWHGFVARVNPSGTDLEYCGYLGTRATDVAVDSSGGAYVSMEGAGFFGVGVAKVSPTGDSLEYSGNLPWQGFDGYTSGISVDAAGNGYVCGYHIPSNGGEYYGWIARVYPSNVASGYLRTWPGDALAVAQDSSGAAYVVTNHWAEGNHVRKLAPDGVTEVYSMVIPGNWTLRDIAVDGLNRACIAGVTVGGLPVVGGPDDGFNGRTDAFAARLNPNGDGLEFCGYIGGSESDEAWGIAVDTAGQIYVGGWTSSGRDTFPVRTGPALDPGGEGDVFVAKLSELPPPPAPAGLTATALSSSRIALQWQPVTGVDSVEVEQSCGAGPYALIQTLAAGATQLVVTGLAPATLYSYRVRAFNTAGPSSYSNEAATVTPELEAPALIAVAGDETGCNLRVTWADRCETEARFHVERSVSGEPFEEIGQAPSSGGIGSRVTYFDSGLAWTTLYTYRVRVEDAHGRMSPYSNELAGWTLLVASPSDLSARPLNPVQIRLTWTDNAPAEHGYHIERAVGAGAFSEIARRGPVAGRGGLGTHTDDGLTPGTQYRYRVRTRRGVVLSPYSNEATAATDGLPPAPTGLVVTRIDARTRRMTFVDQSIGEDGFVIDLGPGPAPPRTRRAVLAPSSRESGRTVTFTSNAWVGAATFVFRIAAFRRTPSRLIYGPYSDWVEEIRPALRGGR